MQEAPSPRGTGDDELGRGHDLAELRCIVLGGSGFIGHHLCQRLRGEVARLGALGRSATPPPALAGIEWHRGDLGEPRSIGAALAGFDTVFHLVSTTTPATANADMIGDVEGNVVGTLQLLDLCRSSGVRRIVFVSSGGTVYGVRERLPIAENAPTEPIAAHGISKLAIEKHLALREHLHGLEHRVLRVANPYGPFQTAANEQGVIAAFLRRLAAGQPLQIWGRGDVTRDYVYVEDVADALARAAVHQGPERVFNVGSGEERSLLEVVAALRRVLDVPIAVEHGPGRPVDVPRNVLDVRRAARVLGWRPRVGFDDGLARTAAWMGLR